MEQVEEIQRPRQREQNVNERARIEAHRVPLREKRQAGEVVRIPKWNLPGAITLADVVRERVTEAGGKVTDFKGGSNFIFGGEMIATNPHVADEFLKVVKQKFNEA